MKDINPKTVTAIVKKQKKKEYAKNYNYKTKYGITLEQYNLIKESQEGCCKICKEKTDNLVVDHCHTTDKVRGLLCTHCNLGLGHFKDNPETIKASLLYLQESRSYEVSGVKLVQKEFCNSPLFQIKTIN